MTDAQRHEQQIAPIADEAALDEASERVARHARRVTLWQRRLAESTEAYLQVAALDTEATHRAHVWDCCKIR
ncbi:hypothetical protein [Nocardia mexicana]|uniref:hypothetical protein n=1 Tax=Nocardia mexicana TaxID=279262 RepID=UPI000835D2FD|nr:hypothetical protein [Nocardia mexicana]